MAGNSNSGRTPGAPNKNKRLFREAIEEKLGCTIPDRLVDILIILREKDLDPGRELGLLISVLPYCYPKFAPVEAPKPMSEEERDRADEEDSEFLKQTDNDPDPETLQK